MPTFISIGIALPAVFSMICILYPTVTHAAPSPFQAKHSTRRTRSIGKTIVESFHPETTFETFGTGLEQPDSTDGTLSELAVSFVAKRLDVDSNDVAYRSGYTTKVGKYAYLQQSYNGVPFANAVANIAWRGDRVVSFGSSFVKTDEVAPSNPTLTLDSVLPGAEEALAGRYNRHPSTLEYLARPDNSVALVHVFQIQNEEIGTWYEAFVDAHSGQLLSVTDFVADTLYTVLPIKNQTLKDGVKTVVDPQDMDSSPLGWHDGNPKDIKTTAGNNGVSFKLTELFQIKERSATMGFQYAYQEDLFPLIPINVKAACVNAFYIVNTVHDITYNYGFTERAFNFQADNFGKGGVGNDRVLISVQDITGVNNANFATPPDGQSGMCRMYIWTFTPVARDGAMENDIVVHELTHGLTNRMTGGGTGRCLQTIEAGGMGEGWSDAFAEWTEQKSEEVLDYVIGQYVTNKPAGIRKYPYSTNVTTNPLRYSSVAKLDEVHNIGEVWANMLHNVYAVLVEAHGFSETANTNPSSPKGNVVYLHLFIDALAIQPCNPTFITARDAWIQADLNRYNGTHICLLWKGFASRGLGLNAIEHVDDFSIPDDC